MYPDTLTEARPTPEIPVFKDPEALKAYVGLQKDLEEIGAMYRSQEGRIQLLESLQKQNPELNGNAQKALEQINLNREQLEKKESFIQKLLKLPQRTLEAAGNVIKKHPVLTALGGVAALIALLYFMPMLAPGIGAYRDTLITAGKSILTKVGVPVPEVSTEALSQVAITGSRAPQAVVEAGKIIATDSAAMQEHLNVLESILAK